MNQTWKHRKGGLYFIEGFCVIEAGLVPAVMYRAFGGEGPIFIRPCAEFFDGRFQQVSLEEAAAAAFPQAPAKE